ncbi:hypothetical protein AV530_010317 [Patagioenas fasciata monilis]|uniref:Uncharacterized protein n=1 Tax=Patagioenas fasciata monilis TaxID=372326 RepID=A0A1V4KEJ8_PATFA|nr:hypothetical protein AV530_010317 [Patagioenas fasciata monilis]
MICQGQLNSTSFKMLKNSTPSVNIFLYFEHCNEGLFEHKHKKTRSAEDFVQNEHITERHFPTVCPQVWLQKNLIDLQAKHCCPLLSSKDGHRDKLTSYSHHLATRAF